MTPEDPFSLSLSANPNSQSSGIQKTNELKTTVQKIVKANNAFIKSKALQLPEVTEQIKEHSPIEFSPKELVFENITSNIEYSVVLSVLNKTSRQRKVKFVAPKSSVFSLEVKETVVLAPGLAFRCKLFCNSKTGTDVKDSLGLISDDFQTSIPVSAFAPKGKLEFESAANLGVVQIDSPISFSKKFTNSGKKELCLELGACEDFHLSSEHFPMVLQPGQTIEAKFEATFGKIGTVRSSVQIYAASSEDKYALSLEANAIIASYYLVNKSGDEISALEFGEFLIGSEKTQKVTIINNSPIPLKFRVQVLKGLHNEGFSQEAQLQTPAEAGKELLEQVCFVRPQAGEIGSYGFADIEFRLKAAPTKSERLLVGKCAISGEEIDAEHLIAGAKRVFDHTAIFYFEESQTPKFLQIFASAFPPLVNFSQQAFYLGEIEFGQKNAFKLGIRNLTNGQKVELMPPRESYLHFAAKNIVLQSNELIEVEAFFCPKSIGVYNKKLAFILNNLFKIEISFFGKCSMSPRQLEMGKDKVFCRETLPLINKGTSNTSDSCKFNRRSANSEKRASKATAGQPQNENLNTLNSKENESNTKEVGLAKPGFALPKLGNCSASILKPGCEFNFLSEEFAPAPVIAKQAPSLFVLKPLKNNEPSSLRNILARFNPDPRQTFKEFPGTVKDHEEAKQITERLSGEKLMRIQVGPTELDFGKVFVNSQAALFFQIKNDLWTTISAALAFEGLSELKRTSQKTQIVPSGKTAGFKVVLFSRSTKIIRETVNYVINGHHMFSFLVSAEIVPVDLEVSRATVNFRFKDESMEMSTAETITLKNPGNCEARFRFVQSGFSAFKVTSPEGIIKENSSREVEIVYTPLNTKDEDVIHLEIENGVSKMIRCFGAVNEITCEVLQGNINLGTIAVGQRRASSFSLKNTHNKYYAIFRLLEGSVPDGVSVQPKSGRICPDDAQKIDVEFSLNRKVEYKSHEILFLVRGLGTVKITFSVFTIVPKIDIEQLFFNFEKVTFGNKAVLPMAVINKSAIPAELFLDLSTPVVSLQEKYNCLEIEYTQKTSADSIVFEKRETSHEAPTKRRMTIAPRLTAEAQDAAQLKSKLLAASNSPALEGQASPQLKPGKPEEAKFADEEPKNYVFYLKPGKIYNFNLVFSPTKPVSYEFDLNFYIPGQDADGSLTRKVRCLGTNPRFMMQPLSGCLDFPKKIILSAETVAADLKTLVLTNPSLTEPLDWSLDLGALEEHKVFSVSPSEGRIEPKASCTVKVTFRPLRPLLYESSVPLFIDGEQASHTEIKLRAEAAFPKVLFSQEELILSPVPLNCASVGFVSLINDGYQNSNLVASVPPEYARLGLSVEFPDGSFIGISNSEIQLKVGFSSSTPVSFTAKVVVEDDLKRLFCFFVSGVADNSLLTYGPFLQLGFFMQGVFRRRDELEDSFVSQEHEGGPNVAIVIDQASKAPRLAVKDGKISAEPLPDKELRDGSSPRSKHSSEHSQTPVLAHFEQIAHSICLWLAEYGITNILKFPEDLINSGGQNLFELLEFLLKAAPQKTSAETNAKNIDRVKALVQNYIGVIGILKENNAMINSVRPYFLLGHKDLLLYFKHNANPGVLPEYYKITEGQFRQISMVSWTTLFLQIIKVFFVARITAKEFKAAALLLLERKRAQVDKSSINSSDKASKSGRAKEPLTKGKTQNFGPEQKSPEKGKEKRLSVFGEQTKEKEREQKSGIFPEFPFDKNKVYSASEILVLRWLELAFQAQTNESIRIANFGRDLRSLFVFGAVIDIYLSNESHLSAKMRASPKSNEERVFNFDQLKHVLFEFGIKEELNEREFLDANPISMLLLGVHLFKTLPHYLPRATIEFECSLHEKLQKEIMLNNPTSKTIIYSVKLFGHKNFQIETDALKLEGKSPVAFPVSFYANTSLPVEGKIFFQNRRNGKSVAGAVVFNLKAKVVNRFSMKTFTIANVNLYEMSNSEILVSNPFDRDVDFRITVENLEPAREARSKPARKSRPTQADEEGLPGEKSKSAIPAFFIKQDRLTIRKGSSAKLYLQYFPVSFETHKCNVVFLDQKVGEMQYEIVGTPNPPTPIDSFKISSNIENYNSIELSIPVKNAYLQNSLLRLSDKLKEFKEFASLPQVERAFGLQETQFELELSPNEFVTSTAQIVNFAAKLQSGQKQGDAGNANLKQGQGQKQNQGNVPAVLPSQFKLTLLPIKKLPIKDLHVRLTLKGLQRLDQRVYDLFVTILPKTVRAVIEIRTTARTPVVQNIPVTNNTDVECNVRPVLTPILNGHLFDVPANPFTVKKKSVLNLPLKFASGWVEKAEAKLSIFNTTTNDNYEYHVKAESEEPLSEDHVELYTKAKKATELALKVRNPIAEARAFKVDCDIPEASFQKSVVLEEGKTTEFRIGFVPIIGGNFMYSVTFTDEQGRYFWYLVTLHVDSPEPSRVFALASELRKPVILKIDLENKRGRSVEYKVVLVGEFLSGDGVFELEAFSKDSYSLFYFPLRIESARKKIGFLSDEEGELWFDIECRSEEAKPIKLPTFKAELGKSVAQQIALKNPLKKKPTMVLVEIAEKSNFSVSSRKFEIAAGESASVEIVYTPKQLNKAENEIITFRSNDIGDWKYNVFGVGVPPTDFEPVTLSTALGSSVTKSLAFKNPFDQECPFHVLIESAEKSKPVFEIIVPKQKSNLLPALANFQIIVKFSPAEIFNYSAKVVVKANESLFWCFPLFGVTEAVQNYSEFVIKTKCGVEAELVNSYQLAGVNEFDQNEAFDFAVKTAHKESANIDKWLKVVPLKNKLASAQEALTFSFVFLPNKPFKTFAEFVLSRPSGGRWKFKVLLEAAEPDFFDTLNIVSQLNVRKTVQFRLFNNDKKNSSAFAAYFTQDSDSEFVVNPAKGVLEPAIKDGSIIEVSYLPTQYGKAKTGVLVVETDQFYWRFLVKGMFEKYVPPNFKRPSK